MAGLLALIDDFANRRGQFREIEISQRQLRAYKKHGIVPVAFLEWLKEQGFSDVVDDFMDVSRYNRTVSVLAAWIENCVHTPNRFAFMNAVGRMLGNLRYRACDSRASPQNILADMIDQLQ